MSPAKDLPELMFSWIEQRELCVDQLRELARELESLRKNCNAGECVGAAYSGTDIPISVATKITEGFLSSKPMKEAKKAEERSNRISDKIQKQFEKLKAKAKAENPSANPDELDQHTTSKILTVMARRSGLKGRVSMRLVDAHADWSEGAKQLAKQVPSKAVLKGGAKVVGGAVGMVFALHEAIDSWTDMIKKNHVTEASQSLRDTADKIRKVTQMMREQLDSIKKMFDEMVKREQEEEIKKKKKKKKKKRNPKVFFVVIVQPDSSAVDSHGNKEAHDEHQRRQRYENRQGGGGYESRGERERERERESGQSETTGGQGPGGGGPGGWESDSEDEDRSQTDEDSSSDEETKDDDGSEEIIEGLSQRMGLLNVHSIRNRRSQVSDLIDQEGLQALFLTETWLNPGSGDDVLRPYWPRFLQQPREGRGGGVAILHSGELEAQRIPLGSYTSFEYLAALMHHDEWRRPILTITLYRRPGYNVNRFLVELQQLLDVASNQYENILITGDFNIWVDVENRRPARRFREFLEANGFVQHVEGPTYRSGHTLDLVISRNVDVSNLFIQNNEISDHYTVLFNARPEEEEEEEEEHGCSWGPFW